MYIIIAGGGLIGKGLAQRLVETKHDVVVIDSDLRICEEIYSRLGTVTINGNATELDTLENAHIEKCEAAVGAMRSDSDNLAFALLAKHFEVPQIVVRMHDAKYENVYKSAGVHNIARTTNLLIDQLYVSIESPELRKVVSFGEIEIFIVEMPAESSLAGKPVSEIVSSRGFPKEMLITCIFSDSLQKFLIPKGDTVIQGRDRVFLCGTREITKAAAKILGKR